MALYKFLRVQRQRHIQGQIFRHIQILYIISNQYFASKSSLLGDKWYFMLSSSILIYSFSMKSFLPKQFLSKDETKIQRFLSFLKVSQILKTIQRRFFQDQEITNILPPKLEFKNVTNGLLRNSKQLLLQSSKDTYILGGNNGPKWQLD